MCGEMVDVEDGSLARDGKLAASSLFRPRYYFLLRNELSLMLYIIRISLSKIANPLGKTAPAFSKKGGKWSNLAGRLGGEIR
jgi:hypothetical protein